MLSLSYCCNSRRPSIWVFYPLQGTLFDSTRGNRRNKHKINTQHMFIAIFIDSKDSWPCIITVRVGRVGRERWLSSFHTMNGVGDGGGGGASMLIKGLLLWAVVACIQSRDTGQAPRESSSVLKSASWFHPSHFDVRLPPPRKFRI